MSIQHPQDLVALFWNHRDLQVCRNLVCKIKDPLNTRTHWAKIADSAGVEGTQDFFLVIECNEIVSLHCDSCYLKIVTRVSLANSRNQCMHKYVHALIRCFDFNRKVTRSRDNPKFGLDLTRAFMNGQGYQRSHSGHQLEAYGSTLVNESGS